VGVNEGAEPPRPNDEAADVGPLLAAKLDADGSSGGDGANEGADPRPNDEAADVGPLSASLAPVLLEAVDAEAAGGARVTGVSSGGERLRIDDAAVRGTESRADCPPTGMSGDPGESLLLVAPPMGTATIGGGLGALELSDEAPLAICASAAIRICAAASGTCCLLASFLLCACSHLRAALGLAKLNIADAGASDCA
jgi:hypothetical protein